MFLKYLKTVLLQISAIIGAGIFALPYFFSKSHFYMALMVLIAATIFFSLIHVIYCEIVLNTKRDHQLPGYAEIYLGKIMKKIVLAAVLILTFGAFAAYLKLSANLFSYLIPESDSQIVTLVFVFSLVVLNFVEKKIKLLEYIPILVVGMVVYLFAKNSGGTVYINQNYDFSWPILGGIFFALSGFTIVPEIEELFRKGRLDKKYLKASSVLGLWITFVVYLLFVISILAITGNETSADTVIGVMQKNVGLAKFISVIGLVTIARSSLNFLALSEEIFYRDLGIKKRFSKLLAMMIPVLVFLLSPFKFEKIIEFLGLVPITLLMIVIILIYIKNKYNQRGILLK